jgi:putative transposase
MAKKEYTQEQIINKLRKAELQLQQGNTIAIVSKTIGVSSTYYRWHKEYGGLRVEQAKKLKKLEALFPMGTIRSFFPLPITLG